ncbi:MAG: sugar phosphate isomerase/epimerase [Clostridia bacterium]|nr:sugar phosphate isomerase/epimerase [Clostridia bacterium]
MKISTEIESIANHVGFPRAVELCGKAGFDAWDFSLFPLCPSDGEGGEALRARAREHLKLARELKSIGEAVGIHCNQSHAPFPVRIPAIRESLPYALECTAEAGGKICVIHPNNNKTAEENAEMYAELLPVAHALGVKIAAENMWNWNKEKNESSFAACATGEDFVHHIDALGDPFLVACLDLGHAEMRGSGDGSVNMIHALGHRLKALHIHDNDCHRDQHQIPFSRSIDYPPIVKALREIGYDGYFTLEADMYLSAYSPGTVFDGVVKLAESARRLADLFDQK